MVSSISKGRRIFIRDNRFLDSASSYDKSKVKLILLNQPISKYAIVNLYSKTSMVVCADGGSNRLYDVFSNARDRMKYKPHAIVGDLDSLRPDVRAFYEGAGTKVIKVDNQMNTDFEKSILYILEQQKSENSNAEEVMQSNGEIEVQTKNKVIAYGAFGGRIDQALSSIHIIAKFN